MSPSATRHPKEIDAAKQEARFLHRMELKVKQRRRREQQYSRIFRSPPDLSQSTVGSQEHQFLRRMELRVKKRRRRTEQQSRDFRAPRPFAQHCFEGSTEGGPAQTQAARPRSPVSENSRVLSPSFRHSRIKIAVKIAPLGTTRMCGNPITMVLTNHGDGGGSN